MSMFAKALVPAALLLSANAFATGVDAPDAGAVTIKKITAIGSGCKDPSTYSVNISPDNKAFTVSFSEFLAEIGEGIPRSEARKNCSLTAVLNVPAGWQFTIGTFNYRGFMDLDANTRATHSTRYFFEGQGQTGEAKAVTNGPHADSFQYTHILGISTTYLPMGPIEWSPCNKERALILNPSVALSAINARKPASGIISNDTVDGELTQVFGFQWRRCS